MVKTLIKEGFELASQKGSHIKLKKNKIIVIVPNHKELRKGTLGNIIKITNIDINCL
ncbi:MAG: type II toxin-antitoxin system HicA family toxin [Patescibacteria group bacterium]